LKYDILFEGGHVVDGSGNTWFRADVGVVGDKIEAVGDLRGAQAGRRVNAKGHIVAPGFMDIHSHSDIPLLIDPRVESKVYQGITVEVVGNCGTSAAPMNKAVKAYREKYGRGGVPDDFEYDWSTMVTTLTASTGRASPSTWRRGSATAPSARTSWATMTGTPPTRNSGR
jgi:N-acyl-D-aspartate/D-glutamate deacylase